MSAPNKPCGPHAEIVRTEAVRITQCPCGTIHVTLSQNGITLQLSPDNFHHVAQTLALAANTLDNQTTTTAPTGVHIGSGNFVTISGIDPKKPTN